MITLYGIRNCDSVRKARNWLQASGVPFRFHDFRHDGLETRLVQQWVDQMGWEKLLNRRSTTWRRLASEDRSDLDTAKAVALMLQHPALIKRPLIDAGGRYQAGFDEQRWVELLETR